MRPIGHRSRADAIRARLSDRPTMSAEVKAAVGAAMIPGPTWNVLHLTVVDDEYRLAA